MPKLKSREAEEVEDNSAEETEDTGSLASNILGSLQPQEESKDHLNEGEDKGEDSSGDDDYSFSSVFGDGQDSDEGGGDDEGEETSKDKGEAESGDQNEEISEEIVNKDGSKPTEQTAKFIKSLKEENIKLKEDLDKLQNDLPAREEFDEIVKERDRLKETLDTIHFEQSDSFKDKYEKPIQSGLAKAVKAIESLIPKETIPEVEQSWNDAIAALSSGNESMFLSRVSDISDLIDNRVGRTRFETEMAKVWDAHDEKVSAMSSMNETREKLMLEEKDKSAQSAKINSQRLEQIFGAYEDQNRGIIDIYRASDKNKEMFQYDEIAELGVKAAKKEIESFVKTGQVSETLGGMIIQGALSGVHLNERKSLIAALRAVNEKVGEKDKVIEDLKEKIKMSIPGSRISQGRGKSSDDNEVEYGLSAALAETLQN